MSSRRRTAREEDEESTCPPPESMAGTERLWARPSAAVTALLLRVVSALVLGRRRGRSFGDLSCGRLVSRSLGHFCLRGGLDPLRSLGLDNLGNRGLHNRRRRSGGLLRPRR